MGFFDGLSVLFDYFISPEEYKDMGSKGERYTYILLKNHIYDKSEIFQNVYLKKRNGSLTEVDLVAVGSRAIIVFESKNYSGWIFGSEESRNWTQTFPNGEKHQFFNPIWQNKTHIDALKYTLSQYPQIPIYSFIVFSERCELKKVEYTVPNTYIVRRNKLIPTLEKLLKSLPPVVKEVDRERIKGILKKASRPADGSKEKHLEELAKTFEKCPKCGAEMKERKNKTTGEIFYGCAAFPKCRHTAKELKTVQTSEKRK